MAGGGYMGSIIIALPRKDTAGKIKEILLHHGFRDVVVVPTAAAALQETGRLSHGIIISGTKLSDMDYTDLLDCLPRYFDLLLLDTTQNVSYRRQPGLIAVTMPVRVLEFVDTVNMMLKNLDRQVVKRKGKKPRRTEKEENYIRNAKSVLMERNHMTEEEAFRYIQKSSMDTGRNMTETAQMILTLIYNEI